MLGGFSLFQTFWVQQKIIDVQGQDTILIIVGGHDVFGDHDFLERIIDLAEGPDLLRTLFFVGQRIGGLNIVS